MKSFIIGIFLVVLLAPNVKAQQDSQFSMYMFNRYVLNPAYAGALEATNVTALGRAQWVGISGSPNTATLSVNGYLRKLHGGLGAYVVSDRLGSWSTLGIKASYAYVANLSERAKLNIGVGGGIYQKQLDGTNFVYNQDNGIDPALPTGINNQLVPDLDAGVYFHLLRKNNTSSAYPQDAFFVGASVGHILEPQLNDLVMAGSNQTDLSRSISGMLGASIDLSPTVVLAPSANFRLTGPTYQFDINANLYVSPMMFGVSHRWKDSFTGIVGFYASTYLFMAYSYDYTTSQLGSFTTGSHELLVSYTFPSKYKNLAPKRGTRTLNINDVF